MNIYEVLQTKPHNRKYLIRYVNFIQSRRPTQGPVERHHICPKANDLFPDYSSFKDHPWNKIDLSPREHYVAHLLLWKAYGGSQTAAFHFMWNTATIKRNSRMYQTLRGEYTLRRSRQMTGSKISEASRIRHSSAQKGRVITQEHREKLSKAALGIKRGPMSQAHKDKLSLALKQRGAPKSELS